MAESAKQAVGNPPSLNVVADAGYSNGEQAEACEQQGIVPHVPANRAVNNQGDGTLFDRSEFHYDETRTRFAAPRTKSFCVNNSRARIAPCTMPANRKSVERVP